MDGTGVDPGGDNEFSGKKKEHEKIELEALPTEASQIEEWLRVAFSTISTAAIDTKRADRWIQQVNIDTVTYDQLESFGGFQNLDEKIFLAINKKLKDNVPAASRPLVSVLKDKLDKNHRAHIPKPTGRQLIHLIRKHYEIKDVKMEIATQRALMDMKYLGDARLPEWKLAWDTILRRQGNPPSSTLLEELFVTMCRQSANKLVKHVEMYDRSDTEDPEHTYEYMERMVNKVIKDDHSSGNATNVTARLLGIEPKKQAAPGTTGDATGNPANADPPKGGGKDGGKNPKGGGKKGDTKGKGGKKADGKGGKTNDGGKAGNAPKPEGTKHPPDPNKSCITNFFGKCKHGAVLGKGVKCDYGIHRKSPTEVDRGHYLFQRMEKQHGTWESGKFPYPAKPAAPAANQAAPSGASGGPTKTTPAGSPLAGAKC